jgi:hypothetical protein
MALLLATAMTLALTGGAGPALAQGQGQAKGAGDTQRDKKPAQACAGMDKKTKAYADCVKAQAQSTKAGQQADKMPQAPPAAVAGKPKAKKAD